MSRPSTAASVFTTAWATSPEWVSDKTGLDVLGTYHRPKGHTTLVSAQDVLQAYYRESKEINRRQEETRQRLFASLHKVQSKFNEEASNIKEQERRWKFVKLGDAVAPPRPRMTPRKVAPLSLRTGLWGW